MFIRLATPADLAEIPRIELAAGEIFREVGMAEVAEHAPPSPEVLEDYRGGGRAWVADDGSGRLVGFLLHEDVDGAAHIEQVSVHPRAARRRVGRALIEDLAGRTGAALTLTTFAEVPWNGPYYARLGFRTLAEDEVTEGLREIRRAESAMGLDAWPRVCMRREPMARV
ncbi:GNAT family N-acetyltransferase [Streptomyces fuscigenes]|uniref:GNAT family N-acetyltransferase n=1 Tax=Streptomyces fuscigenes TaxID=1528880 RepID=UPI001F35E794|nr:GNAT family N-acetyltransferase [Streptomyces fuscigenes]MCF3962965.1 GNAT family N-acetyltransferase [Streptomyces fuscigenes]